MICILCTMCTYSVWIYALCIHITYACSVLCWGLYLLHPFDGQLEATEAEALGQQEVEEERGAKPGAQYTLNFIAADPGELKMVTTTVTVT